VSPLLNYRATEEQIAESLGLVVMPSNNTGSVVRDLSTRFPGRLAHLMTPGGWRRPFMPYALDNGAFGAYLSGKPFNRVAFGRLLAQALTWDGKGKANEWYPPLWVAVPDVVADARATIDAWAEWAPKLRPYGWPLAFVVQDGMVRQDVPEDADYVFVGGTLAWKWTWVPAFAAWFGKRLHVGRVNSPAALDWLDQLGVGSCDGTGWLRGDPRQLRGLVDFLADERRNLRLFESSEWVDVRP